MTNVVGAEHEFHSEEYAIGWSERFVPTPERRRLFALISAELAERIPPDACVVELGLGPGYLASHLLERMPGIRYCGIDFSTPMLRIARERLQQFPSRVSYLQADLVEEAWEEATPRPVHAVVSTWALHDLGSEENIRVVYERAYRALESSGLLINGDFIKPDAARQDFEAGRLYVSSHLKLLDHAGFLQPRCLSMFEEEIEHPTSAQNYACIRAQRR
ncbi:MAG: class I SAM-dependent methyltransferase [Chromatiales bacterium]|nr:class I SAM-dependent methyltransferase [Chromatiales bacterium]